MNRKGKLVLGIAAFAPVISLIAFQTWLRYGQDAGGSIDTLPATIVALIVAMLLGMGLVVLFVVQVLRDDSMSTWAQALWVIGLCGAGILTLPLYWYRRVWKNPHAA